MRPINGPLAGVRVADFTQLAQGPFATQILGDLGADVIKIEPLQGDWMRNYALQNSYPGGVSISFLSFNRNKRSLAVDLRTDAGRDAVRAIVDRCDLLVENFRPGVMERLGLGYGELAGYEHETSNNLTGDAGDAFREALAGALAGRTTAEWLEVMQPADVWCAPLQTLDAVVDDPQVRHNDVVVEIDHPRAGRFRTIGNPVTFGDGDDERTPSPPPGLGQHNVEILRELGLSDEQIAQLRERRAIR